MKSPAIVKSRPGLLAYLDQRMGVHSGAWPEFQWSCPFCLARRGSESYERKFRFNAVKGSGMCFRCGYACRTLDSLFKALNGGKLLASEQDLIAGEAAVIDTASMRDELLIRFCATAPVKNPWPVPLPAEYVPITGNESSWAVKPAIVYLRIVRGFTHGRDAFIAKYKVGYCATGEFANRLIFPVYQGGKVVYFTSRYCGDHINKGKNPKNVEGRFTKELCLLNYDGCVGAKMVTVVEGPLSMAPFDAPCALMGKRMSDGQLALLETLAAQGTEEFVLGVDPDASREAAEVFRRMTGVLPKVSYLRLDGGDPYDLRDSMEPFMASRKQCVSLADTLRNLKPKMGRPIARKSAYQGNR